MYAIKRKDTGKILGRGNVWKNPDEYSLMVWYDKDLADYYMKHSVPKRINSEVIEFN